ncbi:MAG TPA: hypothetical protein VG940_08520 [Gemmatimonadales bacterium]|nr:hypothetical protein [Gemmatimonadales bacterium]
MPSPYDRHEARNNSGWFIVGGLFALGILGKTIEYLADRISNSGPSGAFALLAIGVGMSAAFAALALGPIGRAVGRRILQGGASPAASDEDVQELRLQVDELRQSLAESHERLDFAERMLSSAPSADRVER